jgi:hypothetical protein
MFNFLFFLKETCQNITVESQPLHHSTAFIKDASGNAAEVTRVSLLEQKSQLPCIKWDTFAFYGSSLVVKDGCQGKFNVCYTDGVPTPSVPLTELSGMTNYYYYYYNYCVHQL